VDGIVERKVSVRLYRVWLGRGASSKSLVLVRTFDVRVCGFLGRPEGNPFDVNCPRGRAAGIYIAVRAKLSELDKGTSSSDLPSPPCISRAFPTQPQPTQGGATPAATPSASLTRRHGPDSTRRGRSDARA